MKNIELAKQYEDYIIGLRRHFHEHPELTGKEFQTLLKVSSELEAMGIPYPYRDTPPLSAETLRRAAEILSKDFTVYTEK